MNPNEQITQIFRQHLGRDPHPYEMQGFSDAISKGIIDPIGLSLFLRGSSEYAARQAPQLVQNLQDLPGYDNSVATRRAQDQAVGRMAELGRPDSSGLSAQFAQIGTQNAEDYRNKTWGAGADYLSRAYGMADQSQQGAYGQNYNRYSNQQHDTDMQQRQFEFDRQMYGQEAHDNMSQAKQNQWFGLAGAAINSAGQAYGGSLGRRGMGG